MDSDNLARLYEILNDLKKTGAEQGTSIAVLATKLEGLKEAISERHEEADTRMESVSARVEKLEDAMGSHFKYILTLLITALGALIAPFFLKR